MTKQWINKTDQPLSDLELKVLDAVKAGATSYQDVAEKTGIRSGHCNNILTKLKNRGLIEKVWRCTDFVALPCQNDFEKRWLADILRYGVFEAVVPERFRKAIGQIAFDLAPEYFFPRYISNGWYCRECRELVTDYDGFAECGCGNGPQVGIKFGDYDRYPSRWKRCGIHIIPDEL